MSANGTKEMCDNHPLMNSIAQCVVCGKPVCGDCAVSKHHEYFCDDASHPALFENYTILCEAQNIFAIELIAKNLEANGIPNCWFDRHQYHNDALPVVYVLNGSVEEANSVLQSLDLFDFIATGSNGR